MSEQREPGSPGVVGDDPTRADPTDEVGALDEAPDGLTPSDATDSGEDSLPPGA